jgi:flavin-dependent dehydrogenase
MWDAVIAGAGPAGTLAATILARSGARVLVVDRARFPRDKLCGDSFNPGTLSLLRRLNLSGWIEAHGLPIAGMVLTGPSGVRVEAGYPRSLIGRTAIRRDVDHWLLGEAIRAGAEF